MKKKIGIVLLVLVLLVAFRWGSTKLAETMRAKHMASSMIPKVKLITVSQADISGVLESQGRIEAVHNVDIGARINGFLQKQYFKEGSYVNKGDVLMLIEPQEYAHAVERAQAALQSARAESAKAEKDYLRAKELVEKDYIPKSSYDSAVAYRDVARAQVSSAQAVLNDARRNYSYTKITATESGRIGRIYITEGNFVTPQSGPLANIVSVDPIYVLYSVDSKQLHNYLENEDILPSGKNKEPIRVEIILPDGTLYKHSGVADFFGNQISKTTGTIDIRATFKNNEGILIPGDFVKVKTYSNTTTKRTVVPQSAVLQDPGGKYVYAIDEKGLAKRIPIEVGAQYGSDWIVERGLEPGEEIIGEGVLKVMANAPVKVLSDEEYAKLLEEEQTRKEDKHEEKSK